MLTEPVLLLPKSDVRGSKRVCVFVSVVGRWGVVWGLCGRSKLPSTRCFKAFLQHFKLQNGRQQPEHNSRATQEDSFLLLRQQSQHELLATSTFCVLQNKQTKKLTKQILHIHWE